MAKTSARYHDESSYDRHNMTPHYLDWQNQPGVYKNYPTKDPIMLPRDLRPSGKMLSALLKETDVHGSARSINREDLSLILRLTYSLTAKTRFSGSDFYYRSVASAGALFPTEIYLATRSLEGVGNGLYHFAIHHHGLTSLRAGDLTPFIAKTSPLPENRAPLLTFFLTAVFFRSAWKYRKRAYRYHLLDTGHVMENLALALKSQGLPLSLSYDFNDRMLNQMLGLGERKEVSLAVVQVPGHAPVTDENAQALTDLPGEILSSSRVSQNEIDYPIIREMHEAGTDIPSCSSPVPEMIHELGVTPRTWTQNIPPTPWPEVMNHGDAVFHRRSRRNFVKTPISQDCMGALLESLCCSDSRDSDHGSAYNRSVCTGVLVGHAEDVAPGFYLLDTLKKSTGLIDSGSFTEKMAHICLDQAWLTHAALHFLFLSNLEVLDRTWGARGYRYAMLTAGRLGERLYLVATALGLGCCGIGALYDWEAAELLGLNAESRLLYLVAVGPVKKVG